jgi:hypothetical protein
VRLREPVAAACDLELMRETRALGTQRGRLPVERDDARPA